MSAPAKLCPLGQALAKWLGGTGWSAARMSRAIALRDGRGCMSGTETAVLMLLRGVRAPEWQCARIRWFLSAWPDPSACAAWEDGADASAWARVREEEDALVARRIAVEEARMARKARLVAAEHPGPRGRPRPAPPLPDDIADIADLDAATIRALSGGTIGKSELFRAAGARP